MPPVLKITSAVVFAARCSAVPAIGMKAGGPLNTISSVASRSRRSWGCHAPATVSASRPRRRAGRSSRSGARFWATCSIPGEEKHHGSVPGAGDCAGHRASRRGRCRWRQSIAPCSRWDERPGVDRSAQNRVAGDRLLDGRWSHRWGPRMAGGLAGDPTRGDRCSPSASTGLTVPDAASDASRRSGATIVAYR